jgi:hypothetical protein
MYSLGYFVTEEKEKWAGVKVGEIWKYYFSHAAYLAYYDAQSITPPPGDIFTGWVYKTIGGSKLFRKKDS